MSGYIAGKDKNKILEELPKTAEVGSQIHEQQKMAIIVRCTEDLEKSFLNLTNSLSKSSEQADILSKRVFWLNVVIALAALSGVVVELIKLANGK